MTKIELLRDYILDNFEEELNGITRLELKSTAELFGLITGESIPQINPDLELISLELVIKIIKSQEETYIEHSCDAKGESDEKEFHYSPCDIKNNIIDRIKDILSRKSCI